MSRLDATNPCVVYRWPDGWRVVAYIQEIELVSTTIFSLRKSDHSNTLRNYEHRWSVAHFWGDAAYIENGGNRDTVHEWDDGSKWWSDQNALTAEATKRLIGFLLDLGINRPESGLIRSSLVHPHPSAARPNVPYPRWVDESRWAKRYEEALRFIRDEGRGIAEEYDEPYLGIIDGFFVIRVAENIPYWKIECDWQAFNSRYHHTEMCKVPEDEDLNKAIDEFLRREILLPESARPAWEAKNVIRGSWIVPSPEEVELYQALGEKNPLLWGDDRLLPWLRERS